MYAYLRKFGIDIVYISIIFLVFFLNYSVMENNEKLVDEYNTLSEKCEGIKVAKMYDGILVFNYTKIGVDNATTNTTE